MPKAKDLTNQRSGKLLAIKPTGMRNIHGSVLWLCQCDCGNTACVAEDCISGGTAKSCGCINKERAKIKNAFKPDFHNHPTNYSESKSEKEMNSRCDNDEAYSEISKYVQKNS